MNLVSKILSLLSRQSPTKRPAAEKVRTGTSTPKTRNTKVINGFSRGGLLEIAEPSFMGTAYSSSNKRWIVGCTDKDGIGYGEPPKSGHGKVVLVDYESDRVLTVVTDMARPFEAAVSDVGTFAVNDCGSGNQLQAKIVVFNPEGKELYRRLFDANAYSIAISACGQFLVVQTCNAPKSPDSNLLEAHDIVNQKVLFSVPPSTEWTQNYSFDVVEGRLKKLWVKIDKLGRFAYEPSGKFIDERKYLEARLVKGDFVARILAAEELLSSSPSQDVAERVLLVVDEALTQGAKDRADWAAKAHRLRGESFELLQQPTDAIGAYETALSLNAKVGVKSKLAALRKSQAAL